jgi:phage shock protein C
MNMRGRTFEVDRDNGKVLGVCAGIAKAVNVDATFVRVGLVLVALLISVKAFIVLYLVGALVGWRRWGQSQSRYRRSQVPSRHASSGEEARERMRSLDLRMQAIETYATSSNSRLAREIEDLR